MEEISKIKRNYFVRLFRGDINLSMTFWVWFVFLTFILNISSGFYFGSLPIELTQIQRYISITIAVLLISYMSFIFISLWRSANNHDGSKKWVVIVKIIIILSLLNFANEARNLSKTFTDKNHALKNQIISLNDRLPIEVEKSVYLIKSDIYEKTIIYNYRLDNVTSKKLLLTNLNILKDKVTSAVCKKNDTKNLIDKKYIFRYIYANKFNEVIAELKIKKASCIKLLSDEDILKTIIENEGNKIKGK